jgi:hypothetical protein
MSRKICHNHCETLRNHFQHKTPKQLFKTWQQSRKNWDIIQHI